jgi:hypothetical protein
MEIYRTALLDHAVVKVSCWSLRETEGLTAKA